MNRRERADFLTHETFEQLKYIEESLSKNRIRKALMCVRLLIDQIRHLKEQCERKEFP